MVNNPIYTLFFNILIINIIIYSYQEHICDFNDNNSICENCDNESNDYSQCKYQNLYCILSKGKNNYSQCKNLYNRDLRNILDNRIACGQKDIIFTTNNYSQTLFQLTEENQNNSEDLKVFHCDYDLKLNNLNDSSTNKINITISFENIENINNNNFYFFLFLLKNNIFNADNLITKEKLLSKTKTITLEYFQNISLYLDINLPKNILHDFSIKIDYFNIENEDGEEIEMEKEDMYPLYLTLYIAIPLLVLLMALIIYLCCKKQDTGILGGEIRVIGFADNANEIQEEPEDNKSKAYKLNENKKKLLILFKSILRPQEYTKTHKKIYSQKCTICYEDFELYISVVSITPCQHIFHYRCLNNWLNKNILNPKCPNCNLDLMSVDINKIKQKYQNNSQNISIKREESINENLLNKNNSKNSNNNINNINKINNINCIVNFNKKNNIISNNNNNKKKVITISHISFNYDLSSNKKNKESENENDNNSIEENEDDSEDNDQNESVNGNIYTSQNRLNDDKNNIKKMKENLENNNNNINNDKNMDIKTIIHKRKRRIIISNSDTKNESNENIEKNKVNKIGENIDNDNKSNSNNTYFIESDMSESKTKVNSNQNTTSQKREGYKPIDREIISSTRRTLN